jgi:hypothetical protein
VRPLQKHAAAALIAGLSPSMNAIAQEKVGGATTIERDVSGSLPGQNRKVAQGDDVYEDELIRTANLSAAKIQFMDKTNLSVGPLASVKLDRFVFNPDKSAKAMVVNVTKGALRWVSGLSDSKVYQVKTPLATIGVRGTIFDLLVESGRVIVLLQEGSIEVCTTQRRRCRTLSRQGEVVTVTPGRIEGPRLGGPAASDFADRCLSAVDRLNCTVLASAAPTAPSGPRRRLAEKPKIETPSRPKLKRRVAVANPPAKEVRPSPSRKRPIVRAEPVIEEEVIPIRRRPRIVEEIPVRRPVRVIDETPVYEPRRPRFDLPVRPPRGIIERPSGRWPGGNMGGSGRFGGQGSRFGPF